MLTTVLMMYVTLFPVILAGIANMAWCKSGILARTKRPIDGGRCLSDGQRIFGDNKTWKGVIGYILFVGIYLAIAYISSLLRYNRARRNIQEYLTKLRRLLDMQ